MSLAGRVAVVTGAAGGIGLACAQRMAEEGARVVIADRNEEDGQREVDDLLAADRKAIFVNCNVGQRLDVLNLVAAALEAYGRIDILVNNAGIIDDAPFLDLTEPDFNRVIDVNLKGCFLVGQAVAKQMVRQVGDGDAPGTIINMSSVNAVFALPDHIAYSITKAGIQSLTKGMAISLAPHGIRVNAIGPGSILTPMLEAVNKDEVARNRVLSRTPLGRMGRPQEIAAIAAFLASDDASYITGETIYADGGRLPLNYTVETSE